MTSDEEEKYFLSPEHRKIKTNNIIRSPTTDALVIIVSAIK